MANPVLLNNEAHRKLRINTSQGKGFGEDVNIVPVIADELQSLVLDYPVCLMKDPQTGQFNLFALLGFESGQNLYLQESGWSATYLPLHIRRQPFIVGFQSTDDQKNNNAVISIDMDSKRVQEHEGEALFNEDGSNTAYLEKMHGLLSGLMRGLESTKAFVDALSELDLIEPAQINITFANGEQTNYDGFYTIHHEKLGGLKGSVLEELHLKGYLQASYLLMASLGHINKLIKLKNSTLAV